MAPRREWGARAAAGLWLAVIVGTLVVGALGSPALRATFAEDGPGCPFRRATGWPCAFCGMTHATLALGHGDVGDAFGFHPLAPLVLALMGFACGAIALGHGRILMEGRRPYWMLAIIAAIWVVNLIA